MAFDPLDPNINTAYNYGYDALGNLVRDDREEISEIDWTVAGKVRSVARTTGSGLKPLSFAYGASGQRILKQVTDDPDLDATGYREHYVRDAQGNIMATYRYTNNGGASLKLNERPLYGSSRLGSLRKEEELRSLPTFDPEEPNPVQQVDLNYELTDHLGNVCAVVTGRLLDGNGGGTPKQAELVSAQGYDAFGSLLPGRNYSSNAYDYGFNGMRKDDEIHGATGTSYDFGARLYDPRVGRWLSLDRKAGQYPYASPYSFVDNSPVVFIDPNGNEIWINDPNKSEPVLYVPNATSTMEGVSDFVRSVAATLDGITASGMDDKFKIVETLAKDNSYSLINEVPWDAHQSNIYGNIEWSPEGGIVTEEGLRQTPAEGLLHELGHVYYEHYDPTGEKANRPADPQKAMDYDIELENAAGEYDTTSDKWIIQEVEGGAGGAKRSSHSYKEPYKAETPFSTDGPAKSEIEPRK